MTHEHAIIFTHHPSAPALEVCSVPFFVSERVVHVVLNAPLFSVAYCARECDRALTSSCIICVSVFPPIFFNRACMRHPWIKSIGRRRKLEVREAVVQANG